jgi:hypothetical protein
MDAAPDTHGARTWYGATAVLALALVGWLLAGPDSRDVAYLAGIDVLAALLVLAATRSAHAARPMRRLGVVLALGLLVAIAVRSGWPAVGREVTTVLVLVVALVVPFIIGRDIVRRRRVDAHLVLGAVTIYLLLGITYSMLLALVGRVADEPLFELATGAGDGGFRDQVYFSFVTLSTTGYGDITPASGTARAIGILTALTGQLYLVTAVATAVSLFSASRFAPAPGPPVRDRD